MPNMRYLWLVGGKLMLPTTDHALVLQELYTLCDTETIQRVSPWEGDDSISLYCNSEGKSNGAPPNFALPSLNDIIVGPAVLICEDRHRTEGQQIDFTDAQLARIKLIRDQFLNIPALLFIE
jgi:hypothetical protein